MSNLLTLAIAASIATACGRLGYDPAPDEGVLDLLAPLNTSSNERDAALTADELLIVFNSDRRGGMGATDLYQSTRASTDVAWLPPQPLTELNGVDQDFSAHLSPDGLTIWYSVRREGVDNISILTSSRASRDQPFDPPRHAAPAIDNGAAEFSPTLYANDTRMIYATDRSDGLGELDLWETVLVGSEFGAPTNLSDLNTPGKEGAPMIYAGGTAIVFGFAERGGTEDLMTASREAIDQPWSAVTPLEQLNTATDDNGPWVAEDGGFIYYNSEVSGNSDLYRATL